jgi:hypothetical protein
MRSPRRRRTPPAFLLFEIVTPLRIQSTYCDCHLKCRLQTAFILEKHARWLPSQLSQPPLKPTVVRCDLTLPDDAEFFLFPSAGPLAQLVERRSNKPSVNSSILLGTKVNDFFLAPGTTKHQHDTLFARDQLHSISPCLVWRGFIA